MSAMQVLAIIGGVIAFNVILVAGLVFGRGIYRLRHGNPPESPEP